MEGTVLEQHFALALQYVFSSVVHEVLQEESICVLEFGLLEQVLGFFFILQHPLDIEFILISEGQRLVQEHLFIFFI